VHSMHRLQMFTKSLFSASGRGAAAVLPHLLLLLHCVKSSVHFLTD